MMRPCPGADGRALLGWESFLALGGETIPCGRWTEAPEDWDIDNDWVDDGGTGLMRPGTTPPMFELCELSFELDG